MGWVLFVFACLVAACFAKSQWLTAKARDEAEAWARKVENAKAKVIKEMEAGRDRDGGEIVTLTGRLMTLEAAAAELKAERDRSINDAAALSGMLTAYRIWATSRPEKD